MYPEKINNMIIQRLKEIIFDETSNPKVMDDISSIGIDYIQGRLEIEKSKDACGTIFDVFWDDDLRMRVIQSRDDELEMYYVDNNQMKQVNCNVDKHKGVQQGS